MGYQLRPGVDLVAIVAERTARSPIGVTSQDELARRAKVSGAHLSRLRSRKGDVSRAVALRIIDVLGEPYIAFDQMFMDRRGLPTGDVDDELGVVHAPLGIRP